MSLKGTTSIRCAIHDWIHVSDDEKRVVDTAVVQRLRHVSQLSMVSMVYPGGVHNRFNHSIGTMHVAGRYAEHLFSDPRLELNNQERAHLVQVARIAALLHDCAHGPFSHSFDHAVYSKLYPPESDSSFGLDGHDRHRLELIYKNVELVKAILGCGVEPNELEQVWSSKQKIKDHTCNTVTSAAIKMIDGPLKQYYRIIGAILHGPLGADRIDFTLRDSYETGMTHLGTIASSRIISLSSIQFMPDDFFREFPRLCYDKKCMDDIVQCLQARSHMYRCVYLHKTVVAASILLEVVLDLVTDHFQLLDKTRNVNEEFIWLNDAYIIGGVQHYQGTDPKMLRAKQLVQRLLLRKLPKVVKEEEYNQQNEKEHHLIAFTSRTLNTFDTKQWDKHSILIWNSKNETYQSFANALQDSEIAPTQDKQIKRLYLL